MARLPPRRGEDDRQGVGWLLGDVDLRSPAPVNTAAREGKLSGESSTPGAA
jgi:hypothetical protein